MKISILTLFLVFAFLMYESYGGFFSSKKIGREVTEIPNPKIDPAGCGREGVPHSNICDPDKILTKDIKDEIEGYLNAMKDVEIAVIILQRMQLKYSDVDQSAEYFAKTIHDTWGVGDKETEKGLVLFLSVHDRVVYISTGAGVKNTITPRIIDSLISGMRTHLRKGDYGSAIVHTIIEMDLLLSRKIKSTFANPVRTAPEQMESGIETFLSAGIFIIFIIFCVVTQIRQNSRLTNYEKGKEELNKLMKEVENIKENKFASTSCPICLEDFPAPYIPTTTSSFPQNDNPSTNSDNSTTPIVVNAETIPEDQSRNTSNSIPVNAVPLSDENTPLLSTDTIPSSSSSRAPMAEAVPPGLTAEQQHARKPMALKCGHVFCRSCLEEYLNKPDGNKCPICRADIDPDNSSTIPPAQPNGSNMRRPSPIRNRRTSSSSSFFTSPFRRTNNIGTLWNYHPSGTYPSSGTAGIGLNPSGSTYTQTYPNSHFYHYAPELRYRLYRIHHLYPDAVTLETLRVMNNAIDRGDVTELQQQVLNRGAELTRLVTEIREASKQQARASGSRGSSSRSFGGGSSRGGGGGGGRW